MTVKPIEFGVKSQLAKLLATENITLEHRPGSSTAAFDVKNRVLVLPVWKNISNDLYDMLVVHEVGHALDTPADGWINTIKSIAKKHYTNTVKAKMAEAAIQGFLNVVEDARIDKRQKRRYPGSKRNYNIGYQELHDRDFFGIKGQDVNKLGFIDRANIYFKHGYDLGIKFLPEEEGFIKRMGETETFEQVAVLTEEIFAWAKAKKDDLESVTTKLVMQDAEDGEGDELDEDIDINDFDEIEDRRKSKSGGKDDEKEADEGDEGDKGKKKPKVTKPKKSQKDENGDAGDDAGNGDGEISEDGDEDGEGSSSGDDDGDEDDDSAEEGTGKGSKSDKKGKDTNSKTKSQKSAGNGALNQDQDFIPESFTDQQATKNIEDIVDGLDANYVYLKTPTFNREVVVNDFEVVIPQMEQSSRVDASRKATLKLEFAEWKRKEKDTISYMVKEFEMRKAADTHARITIAKTGVLDTNKLFSFSYNDDVFRRMATIPEGKNHGFVMILDYSSSMATNIEHTMKQLFSLVLFCKRINIPFEVFLFRTTQANDNKSGGAYQNRDENVLAFSDFRLRNILSSRMSLPMFNRALEILYTQISMRSTSDGMHSTPLNQSILALDTVINEFQKKNRVQICSTIILTDGDSDAGSGYFGPRNLPNKRGGTKFFLRDHVTGVTYEMPSSPDRMDKRTTALYLKILKERTQSNLVGFYLLTNDWFCMGGEMSREEYQNPKNKTSWEKYGFVGSKSAGYDEYYLMKITQDNKTLDVTITNKMSKDEKGAAFIAHNKKKAVNRMLLSNFIARISDFKKWAKKAA